MQHIIIFLYYIFSRILFWVLLFKFMWSFFSLLQNRIKKERKRILFTVDHFSNILYFANKWKQRYIHWRSQRLYCCKRKYRKEEKRKKYQLGMSVFLILKVKIFQNLMEILSYFHEIKPINCQATDSWYFCEYLWPCIVAIVARQDWDAPCDLLSDAGGHYSNIHYIASDKCNTRCTLTLHIANF